MNKSLFVSVVAGIVLFCPACPAAESLAAVRNARARAELLTGVSLVDCKNGLPGPFVCLDENAFGVVAARNYDKTIHPLVAAAFCGRGRVIAYGHPAFICTDELLFDTRRLNENALRWLANGRSVSVGVVRDPDVERMVKSLGIPCERVEKLEEAFRHPVIAFYPDKVKVADYPKVAAYVRDGGGLMTAALTWGWKYGAKRIGQYSPARHYDAERLLAPFGIVAGDMGTHRTGRDGKGYDAATPFPAGSTLPEALDAIERDGSLEKTPEGRQVAKTLLQVAATYPPDRSALYARLLALAAKADPKLVPSRANPMRDSGDVLARLAIILRQNAWQADLLAPQRADPAAASYPGLVATNAPRVTAEVKVDLSVPKWRSTGLFAPAGEPMTVTLPEGAEKFGLMLRIGTTSDDVTANAEWKRAPLVTAQYALTSGVTTVSSPFGGLVYIVVPDGLSTTTAVTVAGAVRAAHFVLGRDTDSDWKAAVTASGAPQAELEGRHLVITCDRAQAATVAEPTALMEFWDKILELDARLTGFDRPDAAPQRICGDVQLTGGLLHDGYPVMYYTAEKGVDEVVDLNRLRASGYWGLFHELGHNHQNRAWTFSGMGEVTVNLFTLYDYEKALGIDARKAYPGHTDLESCAARVMEFRDEKYTFDGYKSDPFLALEALTRLKEVFGWELFERMFREYRAPVVGALPRNDGQRIDQFASRMSRLTGRNLAAYFVKWRWPISEAVQAECAKYPAATDPRLWAYLEGVAEGAVVKLHLTPEKNAVGNEPAWTSFNVHLQAEARQSQLVRMLQTGRNGRLAATVRDETDGRTYSCDSYAFGDVRKDLSGKTFRLAAHQLGCTPALGHAYTVALKVFEGEALRYEGTSDKGAFNSFDENFTLYGPVHFEPAVARKAKNSLTGLRALFVGDSICEAICEVHVPRLWYTAGWPGRIGWANRMRWMNRGVSGATFSNVWGGNTIRRQLQGLEGFAFDLILANGGVNDGMGRAPCGEVAKGTAEEYDGEAESFKTFAGSLEQFFWLLRKTHPEAKVGYIVNYRVAPEIWSDCGPHFAAFIPTIRRICEKWSIPYLDLWNNDSVNAQTKPGSRTSFGDSLHANDRGYDIITPYIEEFAAAIADGRAKPGVEFVPRAHVFEDPHPDVVTDRDVNVALGKPYCLANGEWECGVYTDGKIEGKGRTGSVTSFANSFRSHCSVTVNLGALYTVDKVRAFTGLGNGVTTWAAWGTDDDTKPLSEWKLLYNKSNTRMSTAAGTSGAFAPTEVKCVRFVCYCERGVGLMGFTEVEVYGRPCAKGGTMQTSVAVPANLENLALKGRKISRTSKWQTEPDSGKSAGLDGECWYEIDLGPKLCRIEAVGLDDPKSRWSAYATDDATKPIREWTYLGSKKDIYPFTPGWNSTNHFLVAAGGRKAQAVRFYCDGTYREDWWPERMSVYGTVLDEAAPARPPQVRKPCKVHAWSRAKVTKPAQGDEPGEMTATCSACGAERVAKGVDPQLGVNFALGHAATAYGHAKPYAIATDGDRGYRVRWRGVVPAFAPEVTDLSGGWAEVDLGEVRTVSSVRLVDDGSDAPNFYGVYVSDDRTKPIGSWRKVVEKRDGRTAGAEGYVLPFSPTPARYVRVYATRHNAGFAEIEVYGGRR